MAKSTTKGLRLKTYGEAKTHGECVANKFSTEFIIWRNIKSRCYNPNNKRYDRYGGRGITMYSPWVNDLSAFILYVGRRPSKNHTLDRINNNGHYEPGNLRWTDKFQQANNKENNVVMTLNGVSKTRAEWSQETGIPYYTIRQRIKLGWTIEKTLTTAPRADKRRKVNILS